MRRVDENGPAGNHRNQRQNSGDVENQQQVDGGNRPDEPDEIFARADDPAQRDRAALSLLGDDFGCGSHALSLTPGFSQVKTGVPYPSRKSFPVISSGFSSPNNPIMVGATSSNAPPWRNFTPFESSSIR